VTLHKPIRLKDVFLDRKMKKKKLYLDSGSRISGSHSGAFILERCVTDGETATKFFGLANRSIIDSTRYLKKNQIKVLDNLSLKKQTWQNVFT
jgi:hypothetical protein